MATIHYLFRLGIGVVDSKAEESIYRFPFPNTTHIKYELEWQLCTKLYDRPKQAGPGRARIWPVYWALQKVLVEWGKGGDSGNLTSRVGSLSSAAWNVSQRTITSQISTREKWCVSIVVYSSMARFSGCWPKRWKKRTKSQYHSIAAAAASHQHLQTTICQVHCR